METLVLVFAKITSALLAESLHGVRTQGQQSVLNTAKSTVEVHFVRRGVYVPTETGVYYSLRLHRSDRESIWDLRRDAQILA
jgi:hypothetical protein